MQWKYGSDGVSRPVISSFNRDYGDSTFFDDITVKYKNNQYHIIRIMMNDNDDEWWCCEVNLNK